MLKELMNSFLVLVNGKKHEREVISPASQSREAVAASKAGCNRSRVIIKAQCPACLNIMERVVTVSGDLDELERRLRFSCIHCGQMWRGEINLVVDVKRVKRLRRRR